MYVGPVTALDPDLQRDLGLLMKDLSSSYQGEPINSHDLALAIASPDQEQFVAVRDGHGVGAGSISIIPTSFSASGDLLPQHTAWLASFIVHESYRGKLPDEEKSVASQLWDGMTGWIKKRGVSTLEFMTESDRGAALEFYLRKGATEVGSANLYNVPVETSNTLSDVTSGETFGMIYETCKTQIALHLYDGKEFLFPADISRHMQVAANRGISLIQYIAPADSPAANSLRNAGIEPHREEMILRVVL